MKHVRLAAAILVLAPSLLLAQAQGRIKGSVLTTAKQPIVGAKIVITCPEINNYRREVVTDDKGNYATIIADGTKEYMFHVEAVGYQPIEQMNKPKIGGQTLELNFTLVSGAEIEAAAQKAALEQPGVKEQREGAELLSAGKMEFDEGKPKEALADAEKCLANQAGFAPCLGLALNSAQALKDKALIQKYEAEYKAANPTDPSIYYNEAVTYLNKGDDAKARPLLEQALEADPKHADTLFQLGMVYFRTGDTAKAKDLLQRFLEIAPDHKEAPTAKEMLKYM